MKRALLLLALAACGDNLGTDVADPEFASSFDGESVAYFGNVIAVAPPAPPEPIGDASVCFDGDEVCTTTDDDGGFLLTGPDDDLETVIEVTAPDVLASRIPTSPSATGDRSLSGIIMLSEDVIELRAGDFDVDPRLDERGVVLVLSTFYDDGDVELAIDDATTAYVNQSGIPDPSQTSLGPIGVAIFFDVPPGEVLLRSTVGRCDAADDGWRTDDPGTIRLPVVAGAITIVHPLCNGD